MPPFPFHPKTRGCRGGTSRVGVRGSGRDPFGELGAHVCRPMWLHCCGRPPAGASALELSPPPQPGAQALRFQKEKFLSPREVAVGASGLRFGARLGGRPPPYPDREGVRCRAFPEFSRFDCGFQKARVVSIQREGEARPSPTQPLTWPRAPRRETTLWRGRWCQWLCPAVIFRKPRPWNVSIED